MGQEARHKINIVNEVHHLLRHERYVYVFIAVTAGLLLASGVYYFRRMERIFADVA